MYLVGLHITGMYECGKKCVVLVVAGQHRCAPHSHSFHLLLAGFKLLLGSGVGTVRLYDTEAKKNLCEISIDEDMPR